MLIDNPAAMLLEIFKKTKELKGDSNCAAVWKDLVGLPHASSLELLTRMAKVIELTSQMQKIVKEEFPDQIDECQYVVKRISALFISQKNSSSWKDSMKFIDNHTISYLNMLSPLIQTKINNSSPSKDKLFSIQEKIREILEEILISDSTDFDDSIKKYLVRMFQRMDIAIDEYHLSGLSPIIEAVEATIGHTTFDDG
jgi:hypothetical protein